MLEIEDTYHSIIKVKDYSATTHETGLPMKTSINIFGEGSPIYQLYPPDLSTPTRHRGMGDLGKIIMAIIHHR